MERTEDRVKIGKDKVVAIEYTIKNEQGDVLDTSSGRGPLVYLHGHRQIVPGVEDAIEGLDSGDALEIAVSPSDAYGERDPNAVIMLPRHAFPWPEDEEIEKGALFRAYRPDGQPVIFSVVEASDEWVIVDANHPLAGQTLLIAVQVISIRAATTEELLHGHVHVDSAASSEPAA
jgi:FKBP-type peptidyl-prolyl cis-trans isomerase SlyD